MKTEKMSYKKIFVLGLGFFGISVIWSLYNAYVPIFLKDFALSSFVIGFIMTIDNIFAILLLPYIGALSDQTRTKMGRRMPYILIGAPIAALFFWLIPISWAMRSLGMMMATIIIMNFAMAIFRSPVIALMPDITPSKYRSQANGIINFMGGLGALLVYFAGKPLYDKNPAYPFYVGALLMLGASLLVVVLVKEPKEYRTGKSGKIDFSMRKSFRELVENLKDVFASKEKSLLLMLISILLWFIAFNAIETFFTSFAKFYIGIKASTGTLALGVFSLTFMLFSVFAGFMGTKFGRKKTMIVGLLIMVFIVMMSYVFATNSLRPRSVEILKTYEKQLKAKLGSIPQSPAEAIDRLKDVKGAEDLLKDMEASMKKIERKFLVLIGSVMIFGGIGWAMVNVNSLPMVVDMTSNEKVGGYTGLYYFFSMAANIVAPPLSGWIIDKTNYGSLMIFSAAFFALSILTLSGVRRGDVV